MFILIIIKIIKFATTIWKRNEPELLITILYFYIHTCISTDRNDKPKLPIPTVCVKNYLMDNMLGFVVNLSSVFCGDKPAK